MPVEPDIGGGGGGGSGFGAGAGWNDGVLELDGAARDGLLDVLVRGVDRRGASDVGRAAG